MQYALQHSSPLAAGLGTSAMSDGDRWATQRLGASGEDVVGNPAVPQYLLLALVILLTPLGTLDRLTASRSCRAAKHVCIRDISDMIACMCT